MLNKLLEKEINKSCYFLQQNEVVALPTESIFGFSSLPNDEAISKIIALKKRDINKGLILIANNIHQLKNFIDLKKEELIDFEKFPKKFNNQAITLIVKAKENTSKILTGNRKNIAIRITNNNILKEIINKLDSPIVSTSANISGVEENFKNYKDVEKNFINKVSYIFKYKIENNAKSSKIIDFYSKKILRN